jgi:hypothetical protein
VLVNVMQPKEATVMLAATLIKKWFIRHVIPPCRTPPPPLT